LKQLKNILSVIWLSALLFALSGKTVHVLFDHSHDHEFVCSEKSTHTHKKEHSCFVCEFELQLADVFLYHQPSVACRILSEKHTALAAVFVASHSKFNFTQRGPPAV
jgi:hypothetical protein